MDQIIHTRINKLSRREIEKLLLESFNFTVIKYERTEDLRDIIRTEVEAGEMILSK